MSGQYQCKVFLASPGDVQVERQTVVEVVEDVNEILDAWKASCQLKFFGWEHDAFPDAGRPQEVINKQIPVSQCDIFICILWSRFGTPPGSNRPSDGQPYLSGTEEEIDKAFAARRGNGNGRPIIMIYRKTDLVQSKMDAEALRQIKRVNAFFKKTRQGDEYEALIIDFRSGEFSKKLRRHLLMALQDGGFTAPAPAPKPSHIEQTSLHAPPRSRSSEIAQSAEEEAQPYSQQSGGLTDWLQKVRLREHPFRYAIAEEEKDYLRNCYVQIADIQIADFVRDGRSWMVFADEGCGKTTLRTMAAAECRPQNTRSAVLCVEYQLGEPVGAADHPLPSGDASTLLAQSMRKALQPVVEWIQPSSNAWLKSVGQRSDTARAWRDLQKLAGWSKGQLIQSLAALSAADWLGRLSLVARAAGFSKVLCLVDQTSEELNTADRQHEVVRMLMPIMRASTRDTLSPSVLFRYFLPSKLERVLQEQRLAFRLDRCVVRRLEWNQQNLQKLISRRLTYFSSNQIAPYTALGQLCSEANGFSQTIDVRLVELAEGTPRIAISLADKLFQHHCHKEDHPRLIEPETFEAVENEWVLRERSRFIGARLKFRVQGDKVYFSDTPVVLSRKLHDLLLFFIQANGKVCGLDQIKIAGWPSDSLDGVSDKAAKAVVHRLNKELNAKLKSLVGTFDWIRSARGRGYYLADPESSPPSQPSQPPSQPDVEVQPAHVSEVLMAHFSLDEVKTLCFEMDIDYDNLDDGTKQVKVIALIEYCQRRNRFSELVENIKRQRPGLTWPAVPSGKEQK